MVFRKVNTLSIYIYIYTSSLTSPGFSIFFKCSSTSLFTGGTFIKIWFSLFKVRRYSTKDNFKQVKVHVSGTAPLIERPASQYHNYDLKKVFLSLFIRIFHGGTRENLT